MDNIISPADMLKICECCTIEEAEVAFNNIMTFKKKERYVLEHHKNKITRREDNRHSKDFWYTRIKKPQGSERVTGSYVDVILKLYDFYAGDNMDKITFSDIRKNYEKWFKEGRKPATLKVNKKTYEKHVKGTNLDLTPIRQIDYQNIKIFFQDFSAKHADEYSKSLFDKIRSVIYGMLEYALDQGIISQRVPMYKYTRDIMVRFKQSSPRETWTISEHEKLIRYLDQQNDVFSLLFEYQLLTGDRFETASAIMASDIDEENLKLYIHMHQIEAEVGSGRSFMVVDGTKGNSSSGKRDVPMVEETLSVLKRAISLNPSGTYVFEYKGNPVHPTTYRNHVYRICKAVGVPYHNPHSSRSYVASEVNTGGNTGEMCDYFGWSDRSMPSRYGRNINDGDSPFRKKLIKMTHRTTRTNLP